jgi:hypothetical protein
VFYADRTQQRSATPASGCVPRENEFAMSLFRNRLSKFRVGRKKEVHASY